MNALAISLSASPLTTYLHQTNSCQACHPTRRHAIIVLPCEVQSSIGNGKKLILQAGYYGLSDRFQLVQKNGGIVCDESCCIMQSLFIASLALLIFSPNLILYFVPSSKTAASFAHITAAIIKHVAYESNYCADMLMKY